MLAWLKPRQPQTGEALAFIQALALDAALPFAVLAAETGNGFEVATFGPRSSDLRPWLAKRATRRLFMLTAQASAPIAGRAIERADLAQTRIVAATLPDSQAGRLEAFRPVPAIIVGTPRGIACAWRLRNPTAPDKARDIAGQLAAHLGGAALDHLFPLPGTGGSRLLQHLKGQQSWALVTEFDSALGIARPEETAASEALFAPADSFEIEAPDWLWPGVIAAGDLTLLGGAPGMGKSQMAIYAAATISRGGAWPDGSRAKRGSTILCETEDRPGNALRPRLEAAGADISRVHFGRHMDLSRDMAALASQADALPDLRLLVLSPVLTFFGATSNDDNTVRTRLRPLFEWAAARSVAVVGIIHPLKHGPADVFAGCDAYRRACRAAWRLALDPGDDNPVEKLKRRVMLAAKVNNAPDALRLLYRIEGVTLPGGIETSRVSFSQHPASAEAPKVAVVPKTRTMSPDAARAWLLAQLADGPRTSGQLADAMAADGISWASSKPATYKAAANLNIERRPIAGSRLKMWVLP
jgi:hypothetical protein